MAFWAPAIGIATGLASVASGWLGNQSAKAEAEARNRERAKQRMLQLANNDLNYNWGEIQADVTYAWDMAKHQALLNTELEKKIDYEFQQSFAIENALANLELNASALEDIYGEGERLRMEQEALELMQVSAQTGFQMNDLGMQVEGQALNMKNIGANMRGVDANMREISTQYSDVESRIALAQATSANELKQYLLQVKDNDLQMNQFAQQRDREMNNLLSGMTLDMASENLKRDIETIGAMVEGSIARSRSTARLGGTSTSEQIASQAAKALGRTYGELQIQRQRRNASLDTQNSLAKSDSLQMVRFATQTAALQTSIEQSQASFKAQGEQLENQAARLNIAGDRQMIAGDQQMIAGEQSMLSGRRFKNQADKAMSDARYAQDVFNKLTVPSFALANRQGKREMEALKLQTGATLMDASMPYRDPIIFEPQRALPGLKPFNPPKLTMEKAPEFNWGTAIGGAVLSGAQAAMGMSYTNASGQLKFL